MLSGWSCGDSSYGFSIDLIECDHFFRPIRSEQACSGSVSTRSVPTNGCSRRWPIPRTSRYYRCVQRTSIPARRDGSVVARRSRASTVKRIENGKRSTELHGAGTRPAQRTGKRTGAHRQRTGRRCRLPGAGILCAALRAADRGGTRREATVTDEKKRASRGAFGF